jgi:hypothetical protein
MNLSQLELFSPILQDHKDTTSTKVDTTIDKTKVVAKEIFYRYVECFQSPQNFFDIKTKRGKGNTQETETKYKKYVPSILDGMNLHWKEATSQDKCDYRISVNDSVSSVDDENFIKERTCIYKSEYEEVDLKNSLLGLEFKKSGGAFCFNDTIPHEDILYIMIRPLQKSGSITLWDGKDVFNGLRKKWQDNYNSGRSKILLDEYLYRVDELNDLAGASARNRPNHTVSNKQIRSGASPLADYLLKWDSNYNITEKTIT